MQLEVGGVDDGCVVAVWQSSGPTKTQTPTKSRSCDNLAQHQQQVGGGVR